MNKMNPDSLTKVYVELQDNQQAATESFWAETLGDNLYRLRNTPFYTYGLNFYDIVYARTLSEEHLPVILKVHTYSGHKTLRVIFTDNATPTERMVRLSGLNKFNAFYENADGTLFAIDIEPQGNYQAVCDALYKWEQEGVLSYETCEQR